MDIGEVRGTDRVFIRPVLLTSLFIFVHEVLTQMARNTYDDHENIFPTEMDNDSLDIGERYYDEWDIDEVLLERDRRRCGIKSRILHQLRALPTPTETDHEILQMIRAGDPKGRDLLLAKHYKYILAKIIGATQGNWYSDDILQAGIIGLFEAANRFDLSRKTTFLTYGHSWILKYIYIEIRNDLLPLGGIGIGRDAKERLFNYIKYIMMGLTDEEIMERLKISRKTLLELKVLTVTTSRIKSLDNIMNPSNPDADEMEPYNDIGIPTHTSAEEEVLSSELFTYVERQVNRLRKDEPKIADVLDYSLGLNGKKQLTKAEICDKLKINKSEYNQMQREGNKYLRVHMIADGWYDEGSNRAEEIVKCMQEEVQTQLDDVK